MPRSDLEQQFLAFRASGDPRAIAAVYDEVAPELLLVAAHIGAQGGDAEDLVSATFLAAMEQAESYDADRALMPWLIGILINQARHDRRQRARRPDADKVTTPTAVDPAHAAESAELADELARKLDALPEYYRQVLTLRFIHGLAPRDIAHSLGLSPETVKTRLRRGQDLLRQALPAGFAAAIAGMATAGSGLPAGRALVLAHAEHLLAERTSTAQAMAAATGGAKGKVLLAAGAVALLGGLVAVFDPFTADGAPLPDPTGTGARAETRSSDRPATPLAQRRVDTPAALVAAGTAAFDLRVRWADGSPAADVTVGVVAAHAADPLLHERFARTATDGTVGFERLAPGRLRVRVVRGGAGTFDLAPGDRTAGELVVPRGVDLRLTVTGEDGIPVAGASVLLSPDGFPDEGIAIAATTGDGAAVLRSVAPGRSFQVLADGYAPPPLQLVRSDAGTTLDAVVDLAANRSAWVLTGRVVDDLGDPVAGARVQIGRRLPRLDFDDADLGPDARRAAVELRTDADGRFRRAGLTVLDHRIDVFVRAAERPLWHGTARFVSGPTSHVDVQLLRGRRLSGRAVAEDGAVVAGAPVQVRDSIVTAWAYAPRWAEAVAFTDALGNYAVQGLAPRAVAAEVEHDGRRATRRFEGAGDLRWDPILTAPRRILGTIHAADGRALAGLKVHALVPPGRTAPPPASTDEHGRYVVEGCDAGDHALWVVDPRSPWSGCVASAAAVRPDGGARDFTIAADRLPAATIIGRVVDTDGAPLAARIALRSLHTGAAHARTDPATGQFSFGPVPALATGYDIYVHLRRDMWARVPYVAVRTGETTDLGAIEVRPAGGLEVHLRHADGRAVAKALVEIHHAAGPRAEECPVADGAGHNDVLAPGDYVLHVVAPGLAPTPSRFTVRSGERTRVELEATPGVARRIVFEHPDDGWDLRLSAEWLGPGAASHAEVLQLKHADGLEVRRTFAPGDHELRVRSHAGRTATVRFSVRGPDDTPIQVDLRPAQVPPNPR